MIFQGFNLAERTDVFHNVLVGRFAHSSPFRTLLGLPTKTDRELALRALDWVGMLERCGTLPERVVGGQKQRVAIARALTQQPSIMLADEPVASLDPPTAHGVMRDLRRINRERGLTVLINIHLMDLARQYTTRMIGLRDGAVVLDGPAGAATDADFEQIYGRPIQSGRHPGCAGMTTGELAVPARPTNRFRTALIVAAFVAFTVATCIPAIGGIDLDVGAIVRNWRNGAGKILQLLQPNFAFLPRTWAPMLETLQMALVGAVASAIVSVPITLWAASPTNPELVDSSLCARSSTLCARSRPRLRDRAGRDGRRRRSARSAHAVPVQHRHRREARL